MIRIQKLRSLFTLALLLPCWSALGITQDMENLLHLSLEELMDIEISTASKTSLTAGEIPASVIIISRQDIQRYGYTTLEEILKNIPGMYMTEDWAWLGSVNYGVRGVYSKGHFDNMIVLVNGVSQMEDGKRGYPMEKINVPVQAIDRIEVIRGPMSVIYGSSAFLGAINIITNLTPDNTEEYTVSLSQGSHGTQKRFARAAAQEGRFSFVLNAEKYITDGPSHSYRDLMSDTSILPTDWNLSEDAKTVLGNESQYVDLSVTFRDLNIYFSHINAWSNVIDSQPGVGSGSIAYTRATNFSVDYSKQLNDQWLLKVRAGFFYNNYFLNEEYYFTGFYSNNQSTTEAQEYELNLVWTPSDSIETLFGASRRSGKYRAYDDYPTFALPNREILVPDSDGLHTNALFSQIKYQASENLCFTAGLRAEWQEDYRVIIYDDNIDINNQNVSSYNVPYDDVRYIPQFATIYDIAKNQHIKFMYSLGEKAPSPSNNIAIIDLTLPPLNSEKSRTLELSYIMASTDFFLQLGVFHNRVSDLIITSAVLDNGNFVDALSNNGELDVLGLELTTTAQITDAFKLNFDISLHEVEDKTPGYENIDPAYAPATIANLRATYSFNKDTHLSLLGHYTSSVLAEWELAGTAGDPMQQRIDNGSRSGNDIDAYASFDANLLLQNLLAKNLDVSLKLGNLTDEAIRYPTINNQAFDKGTLGLDRHVLLTVQYSF